MFQGDERLAQSLLVAMARAGADLRGQSGHVEDRHEGKSDLLQWVWQLKTLLISNVLGCPAYAGMNNGKPMITS